MKRSIGSRFAWIAALAVSGCGKSETAPGDWQCRFAPLPATAGAGGRVTAGPLSAGAAERFLDLPVGSSLGGYTARHKILGNQGFVDDRTIEYSGTFNASVGIETAPRVKALALSTPDENLVLLKADLIFSMDSVTHDVADKLGPKYAGKVVFAGSHSHSQPGHFSTNTGLGVGVSRLRQRSYRRLVDTLVETANDAIAAARPAKLGIALDDKFDPMDRVSHDRRGENDKLAGGPEKDHYLWVLRVDALDGTPIAVVDVFGVHGTIMGADNPLMSGDAPGSVERAMEEAFDGQVVAIHLQGAAGDVSPSGSGGIAPPANDLDYNFARVESIGRLARPMILPVYQRAGMAMTSTLAMEMVTRSVPLGPDAATFTIRGGALRYAPFVAGRDCDRRVWDDAGRILSPIDEFDAPYGAALCGSNNVAFIEGGQMPNVDGLVGYSSCELLDAAAPFFRRVVNLPFEPLPICASRQTTVSAIRLNDYVIATLPGEPLTLFADHLRQISPAAPGKTIVVGYAQGHVGYLLTAEDWLQGGYEPSINFWGPLEGEYLAERSVDVIKLALSEAREDAAKDGVPRLLAPAIDDGTPPVDFVPPPDATPMAGTVPATVPAIYVRGRTLPASAEPDAMVPRVVGSARFIWIGEDPQNGTPRVRLERESAPGSGTFMPVLRRSGRAVQDGDLLVFWTPDPLVRPKKNPPPHTHYWTVEWQAVSWSGAAAPPSGPGDDLDDRGGVPLGNYRFHVEGTGYRLDSRPFALVAGPLAVSGAVVVDGVQLGVAWLASGGWRLLTLDGNSNERVPLARGPVTVELRLKDGTTQVMPDVALAAPGALTVPRPTGAAVAGAKVTDRFGNSGEVTF